MEARLTFDAFQRMNAERCEAVWHPVAEWPVQNWALAIAGEAGELANLVKKVVRGDLPIDDARADILREVADVITYSDLLCSRLGASTDVILMEKFEEVSRRVGYTRRRRTVLMKLHCTACKFDAIASEVRGDCCPYCGLVYEWMPPSPAEWGTQEHAQQEVEKWFIAAHEKVDPATPADERVRRAVALVRSFIVRLELAAGKAKSDG